MGAGESRSSNASGPRARTLHVLRVTPGSPASETDIEPFFDFIVGVDGDSELSEKNIDVHNLERIVEDHEGKALSLVVWSSKAQTTRLISLTPSRHWSQPNNPSNPPAETPSQPSLLGLSVRVCEYALALDHVWHVLEVSEGSPAESAGLVPYGDWVVGWSGGVLSTENDFYEVVEAHVDKPLRVYVYSYDFDTLREVVLVPNRMWGGEGLLGCGVGYGLLHRIPEVRPGDRPNRISGDFPQESYDIQAADDESVFVPADAIVPSDEEEDDEEPENHQHSHNGHSYSHAHPHPHPPTKAKSIFPSSHRRSSSFHKSPPPQNRTIPPLNHNSRPSSPAIGNGSFRTPTPTRRASGFGGVGLDRRHSIPLTPSATNFGSQSTRNSRLAGHDADNEDENDSDEAEGAFTSGRDGSITSVD